MTEKTATISQAAAPPPPGHYHLESGRGTIRASATFTGTGARAEHDSWVVDGSVRAHGATDTIQVRVSEARAEGDGAYFLATARLDRTRLGVSGRKGMVGRNVTLSIEARATRV